MGEPSTHLDGPSVHLGEPSAAVGGGDAILGESSASAGRSFVRRGESAAGADGMTVDRGGRTGEPGGEPLRAPAGRLRCGGHASVCRDLGRSFEKS